MEVFRRNIIIDGYTPLEDDLILASFSYSGESLDDYALGGSADIVYLGNSRSSTLTNVSYQNALTPQITLVDIKGEYIPINRVKHILRVLTGKNTWLWMQFFDEMYRETLYYKCIITSVACQKIAGKIAGIVISFQCDSMYAYTKEYEISTTIENNDDLIEIINGTDEINTFIYPKMELTFADVISAFTITNPAEPYHVMEIDNVMPGEVITVDGNNSILQTNLDRNILDDFNFHFTRLVPGKNELIFSNPCEADLTYRFRRKVGI